MRIAINGWFIEQPYVGIGKYTVNLLKNFCVLASIHENYRHDYILLSPSVEAVQKLCLNSMFHLYHCKRPAIHAKEKVQKTLWEQFLYIHTRKEKFDLVHHPYFFMPVLKRGSAKYVITIHDVIHKAFPEYQGGRLGQIYFRLNEITIRKADFVIVNSEYTKKDVVQFLQIPQEKVKVVYMGVDRSFQPISDKDALSAIRNKYNLPEKFLFYIGGFDVRKNVPMLLRAFAELIKKEHMEHKLVLGGRLLTDRSLLVKGLTSDLYILANELGIGDAVRFTGYIPEQDLPYLYNLADAFIYPSLYEGFGLPALEAMACGTPVLASSTTSIPEIVDREDLLFDPMSLEEMQNKITWLLSDDHLRKSVSMWGLGRAKEFTWEKTAEQTLKVYEEVMGS